MKKSAYLLLVILLLGAFMLSACGGGGSEATEAGGESDVENVSVPAPYAGKTNPHAGDQASADAGKAIYDQNCVSCHGQDGKGDGPAAASLDPKPSDLTQGIKEQSEDYFLWRISEGGAMAPFNSAMPAWKGTLTEDQIWQVITYIETWK